MIARTIIVAIIAMQGQLRCLSIAWEQASDNSDYICAEAIVHAV